MDLEEKLSIEQSVELTLNYPPVSERYYSHYYFVPKNPKKKSYVKSNYASVTDKSAFKDNTDKFEEKNDDSKFQPNGEDTCIMVHSNRICVISLPPKHPIILNKKIVTKIDFSAEGFDRLANKVSGKAKRGAQVVGLFSPLCKLHCDDESVYTVYAGIRGKLIEVNERLIKHPNLVNEAPNAEGYLAIVLPKLSKNEEHLKEFLLPREEYESLYNKDQQDP